MTDTMQLALFLRGITATFDIVKEFVQLILMKDTTTGADDFESVRKWTTETNLDLSKLIGVTADGAPAVTEEKKGFVALFQKHHGNEQHLYRLYCIIHQDQLCAQSIKFKDIMAVVIKMVNIIILGGLNHCQFQEFLRETEGKFEDLTYFSNVWWFSCGKMLHQVYALRKEIAIFLDRKQQDSSHFQNVERLVNLAFLVDITTHMNNLNKELVGKNTHAFGMFSCITAFERKLWLWEVEIQNGNYSHFSNL